MGWPYSATHHLSKVERDGFLLRNKPILLCELKNDGATGLCGRARAVRKGIRGEADTRHSPARTRVRSPTGRGGPAANGSPVAPNTVYWALQEGGSQWPVHS